MTLDAGLGILGIVVNMVGFYLVVTQIRQQALATRGETYTNLCGLSYEILKMIADQPALYAYVYNNKRIQSDTPTAERVQVLICCEMIANYCDNAALQHENIPEPVWQRWHSFIREQVAASDELNAFLRQNESWYSAELIEILREVPPATPTAAPDAA